MAAICRDAPALGAVERRAGASPTPRTPTSVGSRCPRPRLGGCLRQISRNIPCQPPCPARSLPPRQHRSPRPGTLGPGSAGQGEPAQSGSRMGTASKAQMGAGCFGKGSSPLGFGVPTGRGSPRGTTSSAEPPGERDNTASRVHVRITCAQLRSSQSERRGARAAGKEPVLWDTEPPKPETPPTPTPKTRRRAGRAPHGSAAPGCGAAGDPSPRAATRKRRKLKPCFKCGQKAKGIGHSLRNGEGGTGAPVARRAGGNTGQPPAGMAATGSSHGRQHRGGRSRRGKGPGADNEKPG